MKKVMRSVLFTLCFALVTPAVAGPADDYDYGAAAFGALIQHGAEKGVGALGEVLGGVFKILEIAGGKVKGPDGAPSTLYRDTRGYYWTHQRGTWFYWNGSAWNRP